MRKKRALALTLCAVLLAGCGTPNADRYGTGEVGRTIETTRATVVASRLVEVQGEDSLIGPAAGGALGGAGMGWGLQSGWAAVIGAVLGAGVGYLSQQAVTGREGIEYTLQMADGRMVMMVQNRAGAEMPIANGTPVLVQRGSGYARVTVDPGSGTVSEPDELRPLPPPDGPTAATPAPDTLRMPPSMRPAAL